MGGNAFNKSHPEAAFPRMQTPIYEHTKAKVHAALRSLYDHLASPPEAPQKLDHGDVDVLVCSPKPDLTHEQVRKALGATWSIPFEVTSHFALRWDTVVGSQGDVLGHGGPNDYIQVDVHVCEDMADFERVLFGHSYGDMFMILGLIARSIGLSLGTSGLRLANQLSTSPPITLSLSSSIPDILSFFGLSIDRWQEGFTSQQAIFDWIASSRFYNPAVMARSDSDQQRGRRQRDARGMYQNFLAHARQRNSDGVVLPDRVAAVQSALQHFGKWELYCRLLHVEAVRKRSNAVFTGKLVTAWTGVQGMPVRWIMEEVKKRLGGDEVDEPDLVDALLTSGSGIEPVYWTLHTWQVRMGAMDDDAIRSFTMEVKAEMEKAGRLEFDWREAKRLKEERKRSAAAQLAEMGQAPSL